MDEYIVEIVNPANGKQLADGEVGEIVVTPVHNNTWGLLRFGTGDLSAIIDEVCPCGRTSKKLTGIQGRIGEAVKVRGMFVVAKQAESIFAQFKQLARWQISVNRSGQRDEMTITAELCDDGCDKIRLADEIGTSSRVYASSAPIKINLVPLEPCSG
jgi:phenylacetate-CoA ligase